MPDVVMTNHSVKRTKERIGLSKKIADKNAQRALEYGITHSEAKGGLCRYLDKLYLSNGNANNVRVYHRYVYLFRGNTLSITKQILCSGGQTSKTERRSRMRIVKTHTGKIYVDKDKKLEFLTVGDYGKENNITGTC